MKSITTLILLPLLPFTYGQYGSPPDSNAAAVTTSTAAGPAPAQATIAGLHKVTVGANNALAFSPDTITAAVGEKVEFHFFPPQHSVAQSSFAAPCAPINNGTGFFSGGMTTTTGENANVFTITVNDTNPIFFYCAFPGHCATGMAGVINPSSDTTQSLAAYKAAAANAPSTKPPAQAQGGTIGAAAVAPSSGTTTAPATPSKTNAGNTYNIAWGGVVAASIAALSLVTLMV